MVYWTFSFSQRRSSGGVSAAWTPHSRQGIALSFSWVQFNWITQDKSHGKVEYLCFSDGVAQLWLGGKTDSSGWKLSPSNWETSGGRIAKILFQYFNPKRRKERTNSYICKLYSAECRGIHPCWGRQGCCLGWFATLVKLSEWWRTTALTWRSILNLLEMRSTDVPPMLCSSPGEKKKKNHVACVVRHDPHFCRTEEKLWDKHPYLALVNMHLRYWTWGKE